MPEVNWRGLALPDFKWGKVIRTPLCLDCTQYPRAFTNNILMMKS